MEAFMKLVMGILLTALLFILSGCGTGRDNQARQENTTASRNFYGEKITLKDTVAISRVLAHAEDYVGKRVLVKGKVLDVCPNKGCWIDIAGEKPDQKIKVKVQDDVIVFPQSAKGNIALVEGEVEKIELTEEKAREWLQHVAQEKGQPFDSTSVQGPMTIYRIRGIGAEIRS